MSDSEVYPHEVPHLPGASTEYLLDMLVSRLLGSPSYLRRVKRGSWQEAAILLAKHRLLQREPDLYDRVVAVQPLITEAEVRHQSQLKEAEAAFGATIAQVTNTLPSTASLFLKP